MDVRTLLELGRVSNLPTVLSNFIAGAALAGALVADVRAAVGLLAMVLFYEAGMFLNDAFDRRVDAVERPQRPIPSGRIAAATVFRLGFGMMAAAIAALAAVGHLADGGTGWLAPLWAFILALAIVLYDAWHKGNPLGPLYMGLCRMLVYLTAAATMTPVFSAVTLGGALVLLVYLVGLTYVARQENLVSFRGGWPLACLALPFVALAPYLDGSPGALVIYLGLAAWVVYAVGLLFGESPGRVPRAVVSLIAGICLLDALFVMLCGHTLLALLCVACFALTLFLQRFVSGT